MIANTKILVVDEKQKAWTGIKDRIARNGYDLILVNNGAAVAPLLRKKGIELILMDSNIPDFDYLELIRKIKAILPIPIIIVNEDADSTEAIVSLEVGADDFIARPFQFRELVARIKANLRQVHEAEERILEQFHEGQGRGKNDIHFGDWVLNRAKMMVLDKQENSIDLTIGEYRILEALVLASGRVLSREKLFELTRGEELKAYDRAIDVQISRIRKRLQDNSRNPQFIKTVRGAGYMLDTETRLAR